MLLIKVILPLLDKYNRFQLTKQHSTFSIMPFQIGLALEEAAKGRPRYFIGKDKTLQPKILAKPSPLLIKLTGTNFDFAKLIFKPETASKHKNKHHIFFFQVEQASQTTEVV